jgi:glycosyltransferase involved in cell wall biosynthesis
MGTLSVSVIVPTYNRRHLVGRALDSIATQTRAPSEVIVVDDGSSDDTLETLRREYPSVTVLEQAHAGVSAARNRGIEHSHGDWIAFLDSDDEWLPEKLARQHAAIVSESTMLLSHTEEIWVRNGIRVNPKRRHAKRGGSIFEHCLPLCCMSPSSLIVHRTVLEDVGVFDEALPACEDYDLWLRITNRYPVLFLNKPLVVKHGGHADQLSHRYWGMDRFRITALEKLLNTGSLSPAQRAAAERVCAEKIEIYRTGAEKRGRYDEARRYGAKLHRLRQGISDDNGAGIV